MHNYKLIQVRSKIQMHETNPLLSPFPKFVIRTRLACGHRPMSSKHSLDGPSAMFAADGTRANQVKNESSALASMIHETISLLKRLHEVPLIKALLAASLSTKTKTRLYKNLDVHVVMLQYTGNNSAC